MDCPECNRAGCEQCEQEGTFEIASCPQRLITPDVWDALLAAEWADKGAFPVAGGWLAQTLVAIAALRFIRGENAHWRAQQTRE